MFREIDILPPCFKTRSLVTGGTQGIGKAIAEKLLVGATVAIAALNDDTLQYASEKFKPYAEWIFRRNPGAGNDHPPGSTGECVQGNFESTRYADCPLRSFHTGSIRVFSKTSCLQVRLGRLSRRLPAAPEGLVKLYDTVEFVQSDL